MADKAKLFDEGFAHLAQQAGSVDVLLDEFFGFLHRRTDFYVQFDEKDKDVKKYKMGFPKGAAEKMVTKAFNKYPLEDFDVAERKMKAAPPSPPTHSSSSATKPIASSKPSTTSSSPTLSAQPVSSSSGTSNTATSLPTPRTQENGLQIPIGNGGIGENYYWTQTLRDVTVYLTLSNDVKSKEVQCITKVMSISVAVKNEKILEGSFEDSINPNESMWTINRGKEHEAPQLVIQLEKSRETWWKSVVKGHPEIDTTKVIPDCTICYARAI
jgi:hypothetical protein